MKKLLGLLGAIGLVASTGVTSVVSCDNPKNDENKLNFDVVNAITLTKGNTEDVTIKSGSTDLSSLAITVKSSDESVLTVTNVKNTITLKAVKDGSAKIIVSAEGYNDLTIDVTINDKLSFKAVENQKLSTDTGTGSITLESTSATDLSSLAITVKSSDESVLTVTNAESKNVITLTPIAMGSANITVSAEGYNELVINVNVNTLDDTDISSITTKVANLVNIAAKGGQEANWADDSYVSVLTSEDDVRKILSDNSTDVSFVAVKDFTVTTTDDEDYDNVVGERTNKTVTITFTIKDNYKNNSKKSLKKVINKAYSVENPKNNA